jgi:hypothetical protein
MGERHPLYLPRAHSHPPCKDTMISSHSLALVSLMGQGIWRQAFQITGASDKTQYPMVIQIPPDLKTTFLMGQFEQPTIFLDFSTIAQEDLDCVASVSWVLGLIAYTDVSLQSFFRFQLCGWAPGPGFNTEAPRAAHLAFLQHTWLPCSAPGFPAAHLASLQHTWLPCCTPGFPAVHLASLQYTWLPCSTPGFPAVHLASLQYTWLP